MWLLPLSLGSALAGEPVQLTVLVQDANQRAVTSACVQFDGAKGCHSVDADGQFQSGSIEGADGGAFVFESFRTLTGRVVSPGFQAATFEQPIKGRKPRITVMLQPMKVTLPGAAMPLPEALPDPRDVGAEQAWQFARALADGEPEELDRALLWAAVARERAWMLPDRASRQKRIVDSWHLQAVVNWRLWEWVEESRLDDPEGAELLSPLVRERIDTEVQIWRTLAHGYGIEAPLAKQLCYVVAGDIARCRE